MDFRIAGQKSLKYKSSMQDLMIQTHFHDFKFNILARDCSTTILEEVFTWIDSLKLETNDGL